MAESVPPRRRYAATRPARLSADAPQALAPSAQELSALSTGVGSRDAQALLRFEIFLSSAVLTVLLVRTFLVLTGYPQVGGGGLHVAHVLWGGLLMAAAIVITQVSPGTRSRLRAACFGGIGFGLFIDEVGKFLTKDVNYFFRPAIPIIYGVFVAFFLIVRELVGRRELSDRQRLAIAAEAVADLALGQLHDQGRQRASHLLLPVRSHQGLHAALSAALTTTRDQQPLPTRMTVLRDRLGLRVERLLHHRHFHRGLLVVFVLQIAGSLTEAALLTARTGADQPSTATVLCVSLACAFSAGLGLGGVIRLAQRRRAHALQLLLRSVLVSVLFTQLFVFAEYQLLGLAGLALELALLALIRLAGQALVMEHSHSEHRRATPA